MHDQVLHYAPQAYSWFSILVWDALPLALLVGGIGFSLSLLGYWLLTKSKKNKRLFFASLSASVLFIGITLFSATTQIHQGVNRLLTKKFRPWIESSMPMLQESIAHVLTEKKGDKAVSSEIASTLWVETLFASSSEHQQKKGWVYQALDSQIQQLMISFASAALSASDTGDTGEHNQVSAPILLAASQSPSSGKLVENAYQLALAQLNQTATHLKTLSCGLSLLGVIAWCGLLAACFISKSKVDLS
jgi:hypothetical protein